MIACRVKRRDAIYLISKGTFGYAARSSMTMGRGHEAHLEVAPATVSIVSSGGCKQWRGDLATFLQMERMTDAGARAVVHDAACTGCSPSALNGGGVLLWFPD